MLFPPFTLLHLYLALFLQWRFGRNLVLHPCCRYRRTTRCSSYYGSRQACHSSRIRGCAGESLKDTFPRLSICRLSFLNGHILPISTRRCARLSIGRAGWTGQGRVVCHIAALATEMRRMRPSRARRWVPTHDLERRRGFRQCCCPWS